MNEGNERMTMNDYLAVGIAEGFEEAENQEQVIEAWQYIYDNELHHKLQGWFGRTVHSLLAQGVIEG